MYIAISIPNMQNVLYTILVSCLLCMIQAFEYKTWAQQDPTVYTAVDEQPEPIGGLKAFYDYIEKNLRYPDEARQKKISGRVVVKFIVDEEGRLINPQVVRGIGGGCDEEALRLIREAPPWKPGKKAGKPVKVEVTRPITFQLP